MKTLKKISLAFFILCIMACSNDDDNNNQNNNVVLSGYRYDTNDHIFEISYNSEGELTAYESFNNLGDIITNTIIKTNGKVTNIGAANLTYNTSNQISQIDDGTGNGVTILSYDGQGRLTEQSTSYFGGTIIETKSFNYVSGKVSEVNLQVVGSSINQYYKYVISYSQNNVSQVIISVSNNGTDYTLQATNTYTYDNKKNPHKFLTNSVNFNMFFIEPLGSFRQFSTETINYIAAYPFAWISDNNITQLESIYSSGTYTANYVYSYNDKEYPTLVNFSDGEDDYTLEYFYTQQ